MSFTPLLVLFLQTGALLLVALVALRATRRAPALRLAIGRMALVAVLGLVAVSPWTRQRIQPMVPVKWNPMSAEVLSTSRSPNVTTPRSAPTASQKVPSPTSSSTRTTNRTLSEDNVVQLVWLLGCAIFAAQLGFGYWAVVRAKRTARPIVDPDILSVLAGVAKLAGIRTPALVTSDDMRGPVVTGAMRPTIFLPNDLLVSSGPDELGAVLRHEVAHIASGDLKWGLFHRLICIVAWPQPLIWALARPMALASEELCDSHVLASGIQATGYADALLRLSENLGTRRTLSLGIGVANRKLGITARIESILAKHPTRMRVPRTAAWLMTAIATIVAFGVTVVFAVPQGAVPIREATEFHGTIRILGPDGKPVTKGDAWIQITGAGMEFRKLTVTPDGVKVSAENLPIHTNGTLVVHVPGLAVGMLRLWSNATPATELRLTKPSRISGRLLLPDGSAAAGMTVRVNRIVLGEPSVDHPNTFLAPTNALNLTAVSDANGAFAIGDVPPNSTVGCDVDDDRYAQVGFDEEFKLPADGSPTSGDIKLRLACQIRGRVVRNGNPVAGIKVGAQSVNRDEAGHAITTDGWGEAATDADGDYVLKRMPATIYNVALKLEGPLQETITAAAHEAVRVKEGQTLGGMDFNLIPGAVVEGSLLDAAGKPVANAEIGVYGPAHPRSGAWVQVATTDAKGHYLLRVPAGEQYLYTMDQGEPGVHRTLTVQDGTTTELVLRL